MGPSAWRRNPLNGALWGIGGCCLVLCGVLLMQRIDPALASLPTGILRDVFPDNPQWVLLGTVVALLGLCAVFVWLPPYPALARVDGPLVGERTDAGAGPAGILGLIAATLRVPVGRKVRRLPIWGMPAVCGAGLWLSVLVRAPQHPAGLGVPACLAASVLCFCLALALVARPRASVPLPRLTAQDWAAIAAVIAAYIAINVHDLRNWVYAYVGDEWSFYALARSIANGAPFDALSQNGVYGIHPVLDSLYQALTMKLFGATVVGWRLSCILAVALPVIPLYWLGKAMGGAALALAGAVVYAACPLLWAFSHIGYNSNDPLLAMIPAAALLYAGLRADRAWLLFAAGACAGLGWYTLFTGRLLIGVAALVVLSDWRDGWRAVARRLGLVLAGFLVMALPLLLDNGADSIRQMFPLVSLSQIRTSDPASQLVPRNTVRGIYAFLYATEHDHYTAGALFDVISATALCAGCALALRRAATLEARLMLIWLAVTLLLTTPLYYVPQLADTRLQVAVPPAALLAGLGLCSLCAAIGRVAGGVRRRVFTLTLVVMLAAVVVLESLHFFDYATALPQRWPAYPVVVMTMEAFTTHPGASFVLPPDMAAQNPNADLCTVLQGFQIDPRRVLSSAGGSYCPAGAAPSMRGVSSLFLLLDNPQAVARCAVPPTIIYRENQGTLWAFRVPVLAAPAPASIPLLARRVCPASPN